MWNVRNGNICVLFCLFVAICAEEIPKEQVDKLIEDELTQKLGDDLLQSIERKFQVDLERSVDMVLVKIKLLLQNGTMHIQDRLAELQGQLEGMKKQSENQVESCLSDRQNETSALAEKALHQMVVCGYALIGHDPAQAVRKVMALKTMINSGLKPLQNQRKEVHQLLKVCGHDHNSLKKVIKCVISKSPLIKTAMMEVTGNLIEGVVTLTKLMAHGAMHEACLIEVIKTIEDEAFLLVKRVKDCVYGNSTEIVEEVEAFIHDNNATILEVDHRINKNVDKEEKVEKTKDEDKKEGVEDMFRRMLSDKNDNDLKKKLEKMHKDVGANDISNDIHKNKK